MGLRNKQREVGGKGHTAEASMPPAQNSFDSSDEPGAGMPDGTSAAPPSDSALITLLCEQPAAGLAALYDRYGRLVYSMALRIAQDHGAAEEITQDVFLRCWR